MNTKCLSERVEAYTASVDLPHHRISLFRTFPLKSQEEYTAAAEILARRPSVFLIKRSYQQSWGASHFLTHLFSGALPPFRTPNPGTSLSFKSPPERGEWGKEAERTLIWLCNTAQFAIGQWNSISFSPPLVNIHLKNLYRHCLPLAFSHSYSSSAGCF